jgi:MFS family permease
MKLMKKHRNNNIGMNRAEIAESSYKEELFNKASELFQSNDSLNKNREETNLNSNSEIKRMKRKESDSNNIDKSLLFSSEIKSNENKNINKIKKIKENKYIVDNINNILSKLSNPKIKLVMQEYILLTIIFLVCLYYWIFLFLATTKFEQNYCFTSHKQLDACSEEQICDDYTEKLNIIIYNYTYTSHPLERSLIDEDKEMNNYYRPFFLRYSKLLSKYKTFDVLQMEIMNEKTNFAILITNKERWNIFLKFFSLCNYESYRQIFLIMIGFGGFCGSLIFGILSDIYGRIIIIRITLLISTLGDIIIYTMCFLCNNYYNNLLNNYKRNENNPYEDIIVYAYAQKKTSEKFNNYFFFIVIGVFLINFSLWPLLKACLALLIENSKDDLEVLVNYRKFNFVFSGLPPLLTSLIFVNINNFNTTILILTICHLLIIIYSWVFMEESIRYYYELCEWEKLTKVINNIYNININDFRTLDEYELKIFKKKEDLINYKDYKKNLNLYIQYDSRGNPNFNYKNTFLNNLVEKRKILVRKLKRKEQIIIKYNDVKSNPYIIVISLFSNHAFKNSKVLIFIILILLYIENDLIQKELLEPPYFDVKDLYINSNNNYIINSIFFIYLIINIISNYIFYWLYRIDCFKLLITILLFIVGLNLMIYHFITSYSEDQEINLNIYNFSMENYYSRNKRPYIVLILLFTIYFALNGITFYVSLLISKISKTIYRCTFFSLHSFSLIIALLISESIYYYMENYFLFLAMLDILCMFTFIFLSDFKELFFIVSDLKQDYIDLSRNIQQREKDKND